ncbi:UNVERIFIED_CONTAM: hypothetical protein FKN15_068341 [Acipenser sinensis]
MAATAGVHRFNVLHFDWSDKKEVSLSRLDFSRQILQRLLEVKPEDLNCLMKRPGIAVSFDREPRPTVAEEEAGAEGQQAAGLAVVEKEADAESPGNKEPQFGNEEESLEEGSSSSSSSEFEFEEEGVVDQRMRPVKRKPEEEEGFDIKKKVVGGYLLPRQQN